MTERVLVTGITGYIGQHCGAELLRQGYEVVGTVRSKSKAESTRSALGEVGPADKLTLVEADLLSDDGWDEAVTGCTYVLHVASPFVFAEPTDENELIAPAVEGTTRVIAAAQRAGVKRLVLTSSVAAVSAGKSSGPVEIVSAATCRVAARARRRQSRQGGARPSRPAWVV